LAGGSIGTRDRSDQKGKFLPGLRRPDLLIKINDNILGKSKLFLINLKPFLKQLQQIRLHVRELIVSFR
jgi:hypothetical protein